MYLADKIDKMQIFLFRELNRVFIDVYAYTEDVHHAAVLLVPEAAPPVC
jgi:hypothetical protein